MRSYHSPQIVGDMRRLYVVASRCFPRRIAGQDEQAVQAAVCSGFNVGELVVADDQCLGYICADNKKARAICPCL